MADVQQLVDQLSSLSIMDAVALKNALEEKWGVKAAAMAVAAAPAAGGAAGGAAAAEEKTEYTVILTAAGEKKIDVIKAIREVLTLGLKEAKDFVEGAPKTIKEGATKAEADDIKKKIEAAGAKVEIK
jgi:large subunit ribosomal protein L7/L12